MHIDWARETVERHEKWHSDYDYTLMQLLCTEPEVLKIADALGIDKITSIATSARAAVGQRYKYVTDKQRHALAVALLEAHGNARAVLALAFGVTEAVMFPGEAE